MPRLILPMLALAIAFALTAGPDARQLAGAEDAAPELESWTFAPPDWMTGEGHAFDWNSSLRKETSPDGLLVTIDEASALNALLTVKSKIDVFAVGAKQAGNVTFAIPFPVAKAACDRAGTGGTLLLASQSGSVALPLPLLADIGALEGEGEVLVSIRVTGEKLVQATERAEAQGLRQAQGTPLAEFKLAVRSNGEERAIEDYGRYFVQRTIALGGDSVFDMTSTAAFYSGGSSSSFEFAPTRFHRDEEGALHAIVNLSGGGVVLLGSRPAVFADLIAHWSQPSSGRLAGLGIANGRSPSCFAPDEPLTRAEFVAMLVRGLGLQDKTGQGAYSDVIGKDWFASSVGIATAYGLAAGYGGRFYPQDKLTRQELAVLLANALRLIDPDAAWKTEALDGYPPEDQPAGWANPSFRIVVGEHLYVGMITGRLEPEGVVTRGEAAVALERLLQKLGFLHS